MLLDVLVVVSALSTALVSGLLLGFAVVAMPGIAELDDAGFVRAFQVMDGVIQEGKPAFMLLWVGSVIAVLATLVVGIGQLDGEQLALLVAAAALYLLGVQAPTATINIPMNNRIQTVDAADGAAVVAEARTAFESRWNRWNGIRSVLGATSALAFVVLSLLR